MIANVYPYKSLGNQIIISNGNNEVAVPNDVFFQKFKNSGFELKYLLGNNPTIFDDSESSNIIYKITDHNNVSITDEHLKEINSITSRHKYISRLAKLMELGYNVDFYDFEDSTFKLNLKVIDSDLPEIIAHIVKDKYISRTSKISEVIERLTEENPMNYDQSQGHKFYEYRLVNFLVEAALGMTSKSVWSGKYDIVGGIIIVKPNSEILCYHMIDFNKFKQYLKNSSRLDNPSGTKMGYGFVYREGTDSFIKLNFQIKA
ncbi:MAG TPA: HpaII family restriction endonuclease [Salinimicrobium sp.]|nr:HpaII family restriction endonuclease [Salinimicrobium sp.]